MSGDYERANPFVGLRPYFDEDALYFFGRGDQTLDLLELLRETRFVPVLGGSGSGKSSLVRAGLIPMLQAGFMVADRDSWRMAKCRPGDAPLENLAESLQYAMGEGRAPAAAAGLAQLIREEHTDAVLEYLAPRLSDTENVFILVDQFEELFAFRSAAGSDADDEPGTPPDAERTAERIRRRQDASSLVSLLLALAQQTAMPVYVSITMRTDFLGDCDVFAGLPEAINRSGYLVPRLTRQQLREAVVGPPRLNGARVSPRLVDRVLNDVGDRGDQLPVMQHALMRTWSQWEAEGCSGPLDLVHFEGAGGLERALEKQADEVVAAADPLMVERIFKLLTTTDSRRRRVRSPARLSELVHITGVKPAVVKELLDRCVAEGVNFLYAAPDGRPADPRYDIVHESLIRQWPKLRAWVDEERDMRDWWLEMGKKARTDAMSAGDDLLSSRALQQAQERLAKHPVSEAWADRYASHGASYEETMGYIERSRNAIEQRRRDAEKRRQVRVRWAVGGVAACILLGVAAGVSAWNATTTLRKAELLSRDFAVERLADTDPTYAASLAAEFTADRLDSLDRLGLVQRVLSTPVAMAEFPGVLSMAIDEAGQTIALGYHDGHLEVRQADGQGEVIFAQFDSLNLLPIQFGRDGRSLLVASARSAIYRLALNDLSIIETWELPGVNIESMRESADGQTLATVDTDGNLRISTASGADTTTKRENVAFVEFDPKPTGFLYAVKWDGRLVRVNPARADTADDRILSDSVGGNPGFFLVAPRGDAIVTGGSYLPTRIFPLAGGTFREIPGSLATTAAISPDGTQLALGTYDGDVAVHDLATLIHKWELKAAHGEQVMGVAFADFGRAVLSASNDRSVRWTPLEDQTRSIRLLGHRTYPMGLRTAVRGGRAATLDLTGTVRVWTRPDDWGHFTPPPHLGPPRDVALSDNGMVALTAFAGNTVLAQFPNGGRPSQNMRWPDAAPDAVHSIAVNAAGNRAFIVPLGRPGAYLWTIDSTEAKRVLQAEPDLFERGVFSAGGTTLVIERTDGTLLRADGQTGALLGTITTCDAKFGLLEVSRDGRMVASRCTDSDDVLISTPNTSWSFSTAEISPVQVARLSPDGSMLFVSGIGDFALLVETKGQKRMRRVTGQQRKILAAAFSHDGSRLMTGALDKSVAFFSLPTDTSAFADESDILPDGVIEAHRLEVVHVAFSNDDSLAVATAADGSVRVFKVDNGYPNTTFVHPEPLPLSQFSPFASTALSRSENVLTSIVFLTEGEIRGRTPRTLARYYRWDLDQTRLVQRLQVHTTVCVPPSIRLLVLATENQAKADQNAMDCERRNGRAP